MDDMKQEKALGLTSGNYGYIIVASGFAIWFMGWGAQITLGVFFNSISHEFSLGRGETAGAIAMSSLVAGVAGLMAGWLTDKIGPRLVVAFFGGILGLSYILFSVMTAYWNFYLICALGIGIGTSILNVPVMVTIGRWFPQRRGAIMGIVQAGSGIGGLILAPMSAWLILEHGWRTGFLVLGALVLIILVVSGLLMKEDSGSKAERRAAGDRSSNVSAKDLARQTRAYAFGILKSKTFWILTSEFFCFGFCRSMIVLHTAPHVTDIGYSLEQGAAVLGAMNVITIIGRVGMGHLADRIGSVRTLLISYFLSVVSLVWLIYARNLWMLYCFALMFGIGWGALAVLRFKITAEKFGHRALGLITGMIVLGETIGAYCGSSSAGWLYDMFHSYTAPFLLGAVLSFVGLALTWRLRGKKPAAPGTIS